VLVLASHDLPALLNRHRAQLRLNAHANRALQADWNTLGAEAFEFVVLDTLTPKDDPAYDPGDDLRTLEELWLEKLNAYEPTGYHRLKG
jgi:type II secretory pathway component PulK